MSRVAYVNGRYVPHNQAVVHIEDRGFQLADGVYEVWAVFGGRLADAEGHFARLDRSLGELAIDAPMSRRALQIVIAETLRRNSITDGIVYLQVTRGTAPRDHAYPDPPVPPTLVLTAKRVDRAAAEAKAAKGIAVITTPENRWGRADIKSVGLLPNAMAKQAAKEQGAGEAWFVDRDGFVTEGAASNAWIVNAEGTLITRELTANILRGVTRSTLMSVIAESNLKVEERPFTVAEALAAREAFISGAGALVMPVVRIDDHVIGAGKPGLVATRLRQDYIAKVTSTVT
jgi:D-alanine transaminase